MSKILWKGLLVSPAVLAASLVLSSASLAEQPLEIAATTPVNKLQLAGAATEAQKPDTEALTADSVSLASPQTVETIDNTSAIESIAPVAQQSQEPANTVAAADLITTEPVAAAAVAEPNSTVLGANTSEAKPATDSTRAVAPQPEQISQSTAPKATSPALPNALEQINQYSAEGTDSENAAGQVTSVSQLSDVRPTDWAFQALQSLVERYGCIAGYPDGTFRGNRAMTRYEFAAGLNACLDKVNELIRGGSKGLATKEDLASVQKLQEEFAAELATLRGRVDALEARTAELEANQFSTTTKLNGEVIFALTGIARGEDANGRDADKTTAFGSRVRLNFDTSFTGKDLLRTRLQVLNLGSFSTNNTKTAEGELRFNAGPFGTASNTVGLDALFYQFPLGKSTTVILEANAGAADDFTNTVNPYFDGDGGSGALSNFGTRNPIYYLTAGTGIALRHQFGDKLELSLGYLAGNAANPTKGNGLFNGSYGGLAQLTFKPTSSIALGLTYLNSYNFVTGTGSNASNFPARLSYFGLDDGTVPVSSNSYGLQASWKVNRGLAVGGWAGYTNQRILSNLATPTGSVQRGDQKIWNWAVTLAFPDLLKEGNVAGLLVGMEPRVTSSTNRTLPEDKDTSLHIEGFYQFKLSDNISITPGLIWLTAPDHNKNNSDLLIGVVRTTFTF
ncbi:MAG: porin [Oscillatoriales cyanobacterium]|uniref:Iron uptake porin n=1 Tax=Microcoleus anatoxicus PTRS2 TaxID=2705321 RepID=A0ABU8YR36_9CYAN|nr:MAG: porin [Oscillatoriales cyanobacterium]TAD93361.1 MAG: porin [Oscillatoriales cyanobacterium]TAD99369.1 MAG: porin [Oscillatoriales cyanobacterium]TAE96824.1 MAG: porin [Oscillatoriales cyanobacterium]TAF37975.1 MAG: porin [Oscillatoriales cyanobacterium]